MEKMTNVKAINYVVENFGADLPADVAEKLAKIKASFEKKSENRKPTAKQEQNEDYKEIIVDVLTNSDTGMTIKEIVAAAGTRLEGADSTSKMSSLLRQLRLDGKVERTYDKKVAYFSAVKEVA